MMSFGRSLEQTMVWLLRPFRRRASYVPVSALFSDAAAVERAVGALIRATVPRDLIDVAVSPGGAQRHYAGVRPVGKRQTLRYAAIFGLVQLGISVILSLLAISVGDFVAPGAEAVVQLLGPNMGAVVGAAIGAIVGFFQRRPVRWYHSRAIENPESIVVVVHAQDMHRAAAIRDFLAQQHGRDPRIEQAGAHAAGSTPATTGETE